MTAGPRRIQLARTKGYRKPKRAVVVSRPTKWGNPFVAAGVMTPAIAVDAFRSLLEAGLGMVTVADVRAELRGKDLACWCPLPVNGEPDICHAAVLLELANR